MDKFAILIDSGTTTNEGRRLYCIPYASSDLNKARLSMKSLYILKSTGVPVFRLVEKIKDKAIVKVMDRSAESPKYVQIDRKCFGISNLKTLKSSINNLNRLLL